MSGSILKIGFISAVILVCFWGFMLQGSNSDSPINFDHNLHIEEAGLACDDCHSGMENLKAGGRGIPDHSVCESCHEVEDSDECGICHSNPDDPVGIPGRGEFYSGFEHKRHIGAELKCESCHAQFDSADGTEPRVPVMENCQECHLNKQASLECVVCHLGETPVPVDHKLIVWDQDHGLEASVSSSECWKCHTQNSCDECHQGLNLYGSPHPITWKFNHFEASSYGEECLVCHETRETCTSCHKLTRPIPHETGQPFANDQDGGAHKEEAQAFLETCFSCHDVGSGDPTCARCHD